MQELRLEASGLWTEPNELAAPPGALREALNVRIKRANVIEPRPGFPETQLSAGNGVVRNLFSWEGYLWCVVGTKLYRVQDDGTAEETIAARTTQEVMDIRSHESSFAAVGKSLFFTSWTRTWEVQYAEAEVTSGPTTYSVALEAGQPTAQPPLLSQSTGAGLPDTEKVSFRVVQGYRRESDRLYLSAPSLAVTSDNTSGGAVSVVLRVYLPDAADGAGWLTILPFVQVYRTIAVASASETGDEMALATEYAYTSADVTAGYADVEVMIVADEVLGAALYTNETQQGILQGNEQPPKARCLAAFKRMLFYGNTNPLHIHEYQAQSTASVTGFEQTHTGATGTIGTSTIAGLATGHNIQVGQYISDDHKSWTLGTYIRANTKVTAVYANSIDINKTLNATLAPTTIYSHDTVTIDGIEHIGGTVYHDDGTDRQFSNAVELVASVNAYSDVRMQLFGDADGLPVVRVTGSQAAGSFTITAATGHEGTTLIPFGLWSATAVNSTSTVPGHPSRLMYSKIDEPYAVPSTHYVDIGSGLEPIIGMAATRDSLMVFKSDGVWRVSGDTPETLRVDEFDRSVRAIHPRAIAAFDNQVWAWTTNGIVTVSEAGVQRVSDPSIQTLIDASERNITTSTTVPGGAFIAGFEQEGVVLVGVPASDASGADAVSEYIYAFESATGAWVRWTSSLDWHSASDHAGRIVIGGADELVHHQSDDFYDVSSSEIIGASTGPVTYDGVSYAGESTVTSGAGVQLYLVRNSDAGWLIANTSGTTWVITDEMTDGAGTLYQAIECKVEWVALTGYDARSASGNPSALKHWRSMTLMFGDATKLPGLTCGFSSERVPAVSTIEHKLHRLDATRPGPITLRGNVPRAHARCARLRPYISIDWARQDWSLEGVALTFEPARGGERMP